MSKRTMLLGGACIPVVAAVALVVLTVAADEKKEKDEKIVTTATGLKYVEVKVGDGKEVKEGSKVMVHYTGTPASPEDVVLVLILPHFFAARIQFNHLLIAVAGRENVAVGHLRRRRHVRGSPFLDELPLRRVLGHLLIRARLSDEDVAIAHEI